MRLSSRPIVTAAMAALAFGVTAPLAVAAPADTPEAAGDATSTSTTLNFVAITDFHGHIEQALTRDKSGIAEAGALSLACQVKTVRQADPDTKFISAGDNVGGSAFVSSINNDDPTMKALNLMGLDVSAAGNHEFDKGHADLSGRIASAMDAPILAANVTGDSALSAEGDGDGVYIQQVKGVKVGYVGVVTEGLPSLVSPTALEGLSIADATQTANAKAKELKESGKADVVVVLAHEDAQAFGPQFNKYVDAVVGGHTHVPYAQVVTGADGTQIADVQPDHYGSMVGNISLNLTKDDNGHWSVTSRSASTTSANDFATCDTASDPTLTQISQVIDEAKASAEVEGAKKAATLGSDFFRGVRSDSSSDSGVAENRGTESTASNLIADSFADWVKTWADGKKTVGIMNPGGVRADYKAGELTYKAAHDVQPFGNDMSYGVYTGAQLREILAQQWQPAKMWEKSDARPVLALGVSSNVHVYYNQGVADAVKADPAGADRSGLIAAVYVDGQPLNDDEQLVIATNSFLIAGGDNFSTFAQSTANNQGAIDLDVTSAYLAAANPPKGADYAKRQIGVNLTQDMAAKKASIAFSALSFTSAAEQKAEAAPHSVAATITLADGSVQTLATSDIDNTLVDWGGPETGKATLDYTLPEGVATQACSVDGVEHRCTTVTYVVTNNDGSTRPLEYTTSFDLGTPVSDDGDDSVVTPPTDTPTSPEVVVGADKPKGTKGTLARTGASLDTVPLALTFVLAGSALVGARRLRLTCRG